MTRHWGEEITKTVDGKLIEGYKVSVSHDASPGGHSMNAYVTAKDENGTPSAYMARLVRTYVEADDDGELCLWLAYRNGDVYADWVHVNLGRFEDAAI